MTKRTYRSTIAISLLALLISGLCACASDAVADDGAKDDSAPASNEPKWFTKGAVLIAATKALDGPDTSTRKAVVQWDLARAMTVTAMDGTTGDTGDALKFSVDSRGEKDSARHCVKSYDIRVLKKGFREGSKYRVTFREGDDAQSTRAAIIVLPLPLAKSLAEAATREDAKATLTFTEADSKGDDDNSDFSGLVSKSNWTLKPVSIDWVMATGDAAGEPTQLQTKENGKAFEVATLVFKGTCETTKDGQVVKKQTRTLVVSADPEWPVVLSLSEVVWATGKGEYESFSYAITRYVPAPESK